MIKIYENGASFYEENKDYLLTNRYTEVFFRLDSKMLTEANKIEYAIKCYKDDKGLVVLKKEPYCTLFYGDMSLVDELLDYLISNGYELRDYMCPYDLGIKISESLNNKGIIYNVLVGMDYMKCNTKYEIDSSLVETPTEADFEEIYNDMLQFIIDCGLNDTVQKDMLKASLNQYRIIRKNGEIAAMAKRNIENKEFDKIACVYTKKKYRGNGYAKIICATILNEIIDDGLYATLNVDQKNPISYHIYTSIGFTKIFSQGVFEKQIVK